MCRAFNWALPVSSMCLSSTHTCTLDGSGWENLEAWKQALITYRFHFSVHSNLSNTFCGGDFLGGSDGKASAYNAGDLGSVPWLGKSPGEGNGNPHQYSCLACQCRNCKRCRLLGLIPWLARSPGEGNDNPLQNSYEGNPMDNSLPGSTVHGVPKSWT